MLKVNKKLSQGLKLFWHSPSILNWYRKANYLLKATVKLWITFHSYISFQHHLYSVLWNFLSCFILAIGTRPKAISGACQDPDAKPWNTLVAISVLLVSYVGTCALHLVLPLRMLYGQSTGIWAGCSLRKHLPFCSLWICSR